MTSLHRCQMAGEEIAKLCKWRVSGLVHYPSINIIIIVKGTFLLHLSPECLWLEISCIFDRGSLSLRNHSSSALGDLPTKREVVWGDCWMHAKKVFFHSSRARLACPQVHWHRGWKEENLRPIFHTWRFFISRKWNRRNYKETFDDSQNTQFVPLSSARAREESFKNNQLISIAVDIEFYALLLLWTRSIRQKPTTKQRH